MSKNPLKMSKACFFIQSSIFLYYTIVYRLEIIILKTYWRVSDSAIDRINLHYLRLNKIEKKLYIRIKNR